MHAMPLILMVLAALAIAYRFYSAFLAAKVAVLDDTRITPAHEFNDGQNFHPTHKWVLFGHHFAAISGAGPLIGPVLAIQFGYLPGLVWIVVGVCLAGAVQDMLVLAASVRRGGRSLAELVRMEIHPAAGVIASLAILFVVIVALSGLGVVVVKALGGEEIKLADKTRLQVAEGREVVVEVREEGTIARFPEGTAIHYANGAMTPGSEAFQLLAPAGAGASVFDLSAERTFVVTKDVPVSRVQPGSSWGTFTIACTIPIALFIGLYMYKIRKGRVVEASLIGAALTIGATVAGNWIPGSAIEPYFQLTKNQTISAICLYGFIASVLPVWLLLCPRDYLSSFLKIGTVALLVGAVIVANPPMQAPAVNEIFRGGGGPYFKGALFPFCFICIMCGAVSGFHALVSSGTTPKMISKESHVRTIGYGAMLIEGLVAVVALLAAASLPAGNYWALNIDLSRAAEYAESLEKMNATTDNLAEIERQVGGEALRGRTGGAVTLAVGMAQIFTTAMHRISAQVNVESLIKYWFHFAIMFEALFILTTIDTGTRIARFLLQEILGKIHPAFDKTDWLPGAVLSTALVTLGWGALIWTGSINTIWPMFGIANQLLAVIALCVVTTVMFNNGRGKYAVLTIVPMLFVTTTTMTAAYQMVSGDFIGWIQKGWNTGDRTTLLRGTLSLSFTAFVVGAVVVILTAALIRWIGGARATDTASGDRT